ncbi:MAG: hypothetical protein LBQ46_00635, partial [Treponema sp.]|nr:hypothetical protein [Treponema sp.]
MKKFTVSVLLSFAALSGLYAQSGEITGLINRNDLSNYNAFFKVKIGKVEVVADKYTSAPTDAEWERIAVLGGDTTDVDTAEEIAFLSYASGVVDIRPPEAAAMLPKSRESDLKIGALMYQNLQTAAFLRTANAAAYATLFNQFCAENNISKAEVKTYFDRNIAA